MSPVTEMEQFPVTFYAATEEQAEVLRQFVPLLQSCSKDGGRKRALGLKPNWKVDPDHRRAIFSHLGKWVCGERVDPDSGAHPLAHLAWRALAWAWQETAADKEDRCEARHVPQPATLSTRTLVVGGDPDNDGHTYTTNAAWKDA